MNASAIGSCRTASSDLVEPAPDQSSTVLRSTLKALTASDLNPLGVGGQAGTLFATLDGAAVAVVPLDVYKLLVSTAMQARSPATLATDASPRPAPSGLSTIERDPEVAEFIQSRFRGGVTIDQIRDACRNTFGEDRTPSRTRVNRFRERLRKCR